MYPVSTATEWNQGSIEHSDTEPGDIASQPLQSVVPFAEAFPDFQLHMMQYIISVTLTGWPLLAVIHYSLQVAYNYTTVSLSIETGRRTISMSTGTRL